MNRREFVHGLAAAALAATQGRGAAEGGAPLRLGPGPHLILDDRLVARQEGLKRVVARPARLPQPVVTGPEDKCFQPYVTVIRDAATGRFRIWYGVPESAGQSHLATMESADGIRWERPHRVLADPGRIQFGVSILDEGPGFADAARRYKYGWWNDGGLQVAASPDGLAWTLQGPGPVLRHNHDINCIFRDPIRRRYLAMVSSYTTGPAWTGQRRIPMQSVSDDLVHWREPWTVIAPDARDEGETQFYCMGGLLARGDLLIGLLKVLRDDLKADSAPPGGYGLGYTVLAWSHDGEHWQRDREPFLDRSPETGAWDHAMAWGDCQLVVGDETFLYYGGYARGHKVERFTERQIGLARFPRDRYVARAAGAGGGTLVTPPLLLEGERLTVNAAVEGELRVRVLEAGGQALPGFERSGPVRGDSVAHPVRWEHPLAALHGRPARLEFSLRRGRIYGFELA